MCKITFIIPNYNDKEFLETALDSVIAQTYPHDKMSIVLIDDGSTDGSVDMVLSLEHTQIQHTSSFRDNGLKHVGMYGDVTIAILAVPNMGGPAPTRNLGIKYAFNNTDYFMMLDADDICKPEKIQKSIDVALTDPIIGVVYSDYDIWNINLNTKKREYKPSFNKHLLMYDNMVHSNSLVKKEALRTVGLYDEEMRTCEDYDLWIRISKSFLIIHIPESLMVVRTNDKNSTFVVSSEIWEQNWKRIRDKHYS